MIKKENKDLKGKEIKVKINEKELFPSEQYKEAFKDWLLEEKGLNLYNLAYESLLSNLREEFNNDFHCSFCKNEHPLDKMFFNNWEKETDYCSNDCLLNSKELDNWKGKTIKISEISEEELNIKSEVAKIDQVYNSADNNGECSTAISIRDVNNLEIEKFNDNFITEFQSELKKNSYTDNNFKITQRLQRNWLFPDEMIDVVETTQNLKELEKLITEETKAVPMGKSIAFITVKNVNLKELITYTQKVEAKINETAELVLNKKMNSLENGYLSIIKAIQDKDEIIIDDLNSKLGEKNIIIKGIILELEKSQEKIEELQKKLIELNNLVNEYESKFKVKFDWNEVFNNRKKAIQSTEDFLSLSLKELEDKYAKLETETTSREELVKVLENKLIDYANLLNPLQNKVNTLTNDLESNENLLMDAHSEIASLEANKIRLNARISELESEVKIFKNAEQRNIKFFADWQENQDKEKILRDKEREKHYLTIWQNGELITFITNLIYLSHDDYNDFQAFLTDKNNEIKALNDELARTRIHLKGTQQDLMDIQKLNFESKVKLQGVLFLDSMRSLMPSFFNKGLTAIETTIFISGITNHPNIEKAGWISIALFITISILYSSYQTIKFSWFKGIDLFNWFNGKKKDLEALKAAELQAWRDKWNISKNYSIADLEEAQNDKDILDVVNSEKII